MCGIATLIEPGREFPRDLLEAMGEDLRHRGPDSGGILCQPGCALVFRRLAILDPTARADQPFSDPEGEASLVFNGEIYNFRELRRALEQKGATFRTTGDTEVILQGYLAWGEGVVERLEGMFAFVLLDRRRRRIVAARDPFGIKPLYLLQRGKLVALASEMRPLMRLAPPEPDPAALAELLTYGWAAGPLSNLKGIERVPGGTLLTVSLQDGSLGRRTFCDPLETLQQSEPLPAATALEQAHDAVRASVEAHLISDVGYAVQLSGGVDSSLVTAMASGIAKQRLVTFGIKLKDDRHDESPWRRQVLARYDAEHHEVALDGRAFADALPRAVRHMEGPSPHMGCVLLMLLCDRIRDVSKVVLTGEGADEFFGGYARHAHWRKARLREMLSRLLPGPLLPDRPPFIGIKRLHGRDAAADASILLDTLAMKRLFPSLVPAPGTREAASARHRDYRDRLLAVDQIGYLESLLVRQDKMAMAASVEARVPFVHLPLARVLNRLPRRLRVPGGATKPMLKAIAARYLPHDLLYRRKVGLTLPFLEWLRDDQGLNRFLDDVSAPDSRLASYADRRRLARDIDAFRNGRSDNLFVFNMVRLLNVETWLRSLAVPQGPTDIRPA